MPSTKQNLTFKSLSKITKQELKDIATGIINTYDTSGLSRFNLEKAVTAESEDILERCDEYEDGFSEVRQRRNISNEITDEQLHDQVIHLPNGSVWLAGIYRNDDDKTILEVLSSQSLNAEILANYLPDVLAFFNWCQPELITVWAQPESKEANSFLSLQDAQIEDCFWGAEMADIPKSQQSNITLRPFDLKLDLSWYQEEFRTFHQEHPQLANRVEMEDQETLEEAMEENLLFVAEDNSKTRNRIGMLMAESSAELGYKGVLASDFLIAKEYRGQGYAEKIQSALLKQLEAEFDFFCGYIFSGNLPSTHNAKKNRQLIRTELAIPIKHFA